MSSESDFDGSDDVDERAGRQMMRLVVIQAAMHYVGIGGIVIGGLIGLTGRGWGLFWIGLVIFVLKYLIGMVFILSKFGIRGPR